MSPPFLRLRVRADLRARGHCCGSRAARAVRRGAVGAADALVARRRDGPGPRRGPRRRRRLEDGAEDRAGVVRGARVVRDPLLAEALGPGLGRPDPVGDEGLVLADRRGRVRRDGRVARPVEVEGAPKERAETVVLAAREGAVRPRDAGARRQLERLRVVDGLDGLRPRPAGRRHGRRPHVGRVARADVRVRPQPTEVGHEVLHHVREAVQFREIAPRLGVEHLRAEVAVVLDGDDAARRRPVPHDAVAAAVGAVGELVEARREARVVDGRARRADEGRHAPQHVARALDEILVQNEGPRDLLCRRALRLLGPNPVRRVGGRDRRGLHVEQPAGDEAPGDGQGHGRAVGLVDQQDEAALVEPAQHLARNEVAALARQPGSEALVLHRLAGWDHAHARVDAKTVRLLERVRRLFERSLVLEAHAPVTGVNELSAHKVAGWK